MKLSKIGVIAVGVAITSRSEAVPSSEIVKSALDSVFLVTAKNCSARSGAVPNRTGTGFSIDIDGSAHLVTALHVVAGCKKWEVEAGGNVFPTSIKKVYRTTDLALLERAPGLTIAPLPLGEAAPAPGTKLVSLGRGQTAAANANEVSVRLAGSKTIAELVKNARTLLDLEEQGFPSIEEPIINLQGHLLSGDSGAPLIDDKGHVVGIANGHLMEGLIPYSWAFPAQSIRQVLVSEESIPSATKLSKALAGEDVGDRVRLPDAGSDGEIQCGALTFKFAGSQSFDDVSASADPFSSQHISLVQTYAAAAGKTIPSSAGFDVYIDAETGADFAVPSGLELRQSGDDCVARDPANQLEARFSTTIVPLFDYTGPAAMAFANRTALAGEFMQANPQFSTPPIPRDDGMMVQRYAFWYHGMPPSGLVPQYAAPAPLEGYLTLAYRNGVLLTGSVRSLIPRVAWTNSKRWFPALVGLYSTTFAYQ